MRWLLTILVALEVALLLALLNGLTVEALLPSSIDPSAVAAYATVLLAFATVWLGLQTRAVAVKTGELVRTTDDEMAQIREQTRALKDAAESSRQQLEDERRLRVPNLRWQSPSASVGFDTGVAQLSGMRVIDSSVLAVDLVLRNEGGPARIHAATITSTRGEQFVPFHFDVPSTIPAGEPIVFHLQAHKGQSFHTGERVVVIVIRYADLFGQHEYETSPTLRVVFTDHRTSTATFIDPDERSPDERRLPKR